MRKNPCFRKKTGLLAAGLAVFSLCGFYDISDVHAAKNKRYAGIVIDANSGKILYKRNAYSLRYPASVTKVMTAYVAFQEVKAGRLSMNTKLIMPKACTRRPPSKLYLKAGSRIRLKDALLAIITKSANDVACAIGANISGSEEKFAERMTVTARQLGMKKTVYKNASGLPNRRHKSTVYDQARLALAMRQHFGEYYHMFKTRSFKYKRKRYRNFNRLLASVRGVDGLKTGYTRASGYNLATSAQYKGRSVVVVAFGFYSGRSRNNHVAGLVRKYLPRGYRGARSARVAIAYPGIAGKYRHEQLAINKWTKKKPIQIKSQSQLVASIIPTPNAKPVMNQKVIKPLAVAQLPKPDGRPSAQVETAHTILKETPVTAPVQQIVKTHEVVPSPGDKPVQIVQVASGGLPQPSTKPNPGIDTTSTGNISSDIKPTDWIVQVGAVDQEAAAEKLFKKARRKGKAVLRNASSYTEKFIKNDQEFIRVRFSGFDNKQKARSACRYLKRRAISCIAMRG